jgi:hypothetical protein
MSMGAPPPGMDEYQRLMAERASAQRRNRILMSLVAVVGVVAVGGWLVRERKRTTAAQQILDAGGRFAEKDKTEVGAFWNCVTSGEIDIDNVASADQIQQRIEGAYFTQQKTFSDHLTTECVPKIERARQVLGGVSTDMPDDLKAPIDKYIASLPKLQSGIESYAEKVKGRGATKDIDQTIQEVGGAFSPELTPESAAFEKFLVCAIPDLDKKKDIQGVLEFMADVCKKDPVTFMTRVREKCGPMIQNVSKEGKADPSKTFKANAKKLADEDQRQLQAWEYCAKHSRKGKKVLDLEDFLTATGDYMEARADVFKTARDSAARISGKPLATGKKGAGPGAPAKE